MFMTLSEIILWRDHVSQFSFLKNCLKWLVLKICLDLFKLIFPSKGYAATKFSVSFHWRISLNNSAKIYFSHPDSLIKRGESVAYLLIARRGNIQVVLSPLAICCKRESESSLLEIMWAECNTFSRCSEAAYGIGETPTHKHTISVNFDRSKSTKEIMTLNSALTTASGFQINMKALTMETNEQMENLAPEMEMKYNFFFSWPAFSKECFMEQKKHLLSFISHPYTGEIQLTSPLPRRFKSVVLRKPAVRTPH